LKTATGIGGNSRGGIAISNRGFSRDYRVFPEPIT
jgi:hypothetical protein